MARDLYDSDDSPGVEDIPHDGRDIPLPDFYDEEPVQCSEESQGNPAENEFLDDVAFGGTGLDENPEVDGDTIEYLRSLLYEVLSEPYGTISSEPTRYLDPR